MRYLTAVFVTVSALAPSAALAGPIQINQSSPLTIMEGSGKRIMATAKSKSADLEFHSTCPHSIIILDDYDHRFNDVRFVALGNAPGECEMKFTSGPDVKTLKVIVIRPFAKRK